MNKGDFEEELRDRVAAAGLQPRDPTPGWKREILMRARDARARGDAAAPAAPRWLLIALSAAWCLILVLRMTTPAAGNPSSAPGIVAREARRPAPAQSTEDLPVTALSALLAINAQNQPSEVP